MATSPNTDNYTLGKGIVYFDLLDADTGEYTGERDLGNATELSYSLATEKLEHYSSRGGLRAKDKEVISQITPSLKFTLDELSEANLALLTLADLVTVSQTGSTVVNEEVVAHLDKRVVLDYRSISAVTVKDETDTTTYVAGTDYVIDTALKDDKIGRILILSTGSIAEDDVLHVSYTYATLTYTEIRAFAQTQIEGRLRYVSDNPIGTQYMMEVWRVSLTPDGDTAWIGDDFSTLSFTGEILKDETGHPNSPYMSITTLA